MAVLIIIELATLLREKRKLPLLCVGSFSLGFALLRFLPNDIGSRGLAFTFLLVLWLPAAAVYLLICVREVLPGHSRKLLMPESTPEGVATH